jgi:MFS family permease
VPVITRQYSDVAFGEATGAWYVNAGFLLAMMSLPGVLAQPLAGRWSDKLGRERVMGVSLAVVAAAVFALPRLGPEYVVFAYVVAGGFISASVPAFEALLADRTPLRYRGLVFGFAITAAIGSGALGPVLSGAAADAGGRTPSAYANASRCWPAWWPSAP